MPPKKTPSRRSAGKGKPETPQPESANAASPITLNQASTPPGEAVQALPDEEIARKAYALWESRGKPFGSPEEDWYRAMQELRASASSSPQK